MCRHADTYYRARTTPRTQHQDQMRNFNNNKRIKKTRTIASMSRFFSVAPSSSAVRFSAWSASSSSRRRRDTLGVLTAPAMRSTTSQTSGACPSCSSLRCACCVCPSYRPALKRPAAPHAELENTHQSSVRTPCNKCRYNYLQVIIIVISRLQPTAVYTRVHQQLRYWPRSGPSIAALEL